MVGLSTSRAIWLTLEKLFSSQSQARVIQVRHQLSTLKKGSQSIVDYFQKAQGLAHMLASIGHTQTDVDIVSSILHGLGAEYDPLVTSITTRLEPVSLDDLYGHLLSYELRLEQHNAAVDISISTANVV
jgi:hypothetical protein